MHAGLVDTNEFLFSMHSLLEFRLSSCFYNLFFTLSAAKKNYQKIRLNGEVLVGVVLDQFPQLIKIIFKNACKKILSCRKSF